MYLCSQGRKVGECVGGSINGVCKLAERRQDLLPYEAAKHANFLVENEPPPVVQWRGTPPVPARVLIVPILAVIGIRYLNIGH